MGRFSLKKFNSLKNFNSKKITVMNGLKFEMKFEIGK